KGTGRARAGALSVPHRRGGGVAFGPKPRRYDVKVNRKARRRALRAALSVHAARGSIAVLDASGIDEPATKQAAQWLDKWGARTPTLVVPDVDVVQASEVGVAALIGHQSLVLSQAALEQVSDRAKEAKR